MSLLTVLSSISPLVFLQGTAATKSGEFIEEAHKHHHHHNHHHHNQKQCNSEFYLDPTNDPSTFIDQFKPCGWYEQNCGHMFDTWFESEGGYNKNNEDYQLKANVCYPGRGEDDMQDGVHLVQFDIGLDKTAYDAFLGFDGEPGNNKFIDHIDGTGERSYLSFEHYMQTGNWKKTATFDGATWKFGEHCVETFAKRNSHWGDLYGNSYNCMGKCGKGCQAVGYGRDCMKHDVCSYFKGIVLNEEADGFCRDFDCGDEAAQTVTNCWMKQDWQSDRQVICDEETDKTNPNFYALLNPIVRKMQQKRACTLRTHWERNQGMPWLRGEDGTGCTSPDDCESRRCDSTSYGRNICMPRLKHGKRCNEDTDCISLKCSGSNRFNRRCQ